ncbi:MAG: FAD binding domain-containing protein [Planctomycetota bacterium]
MKPFKMAMPKSVAEAVAAAAAGGSFADVRVLAAGTDLVAQMKERTATPGVVVNLKTIPGLDRIERVNGNLEIGALVPLTTIAEHAEILRGWATLSTAILRAATPQVRNLATIAGNLTQRPRCWYFRDEQFPCLKKGGDKCYAKEGENEYHTIFDNGVCCAVHASNCAPVLIAYDALLRIAGPDGERDEPVADFFVSPTLNVRAENILQPGEIITRVILPKASEGRSSAYMETRERQSFDWATSGATASFRPNGKQMADARIVLNAVGPLPLRRKDLENMLNGKEVSDDLLRAVGDAAVKGATPLRDNAYKVQLVKVCLARAIRAAMEGQKQ